MLAGLSLRMIIVDLLVSNKEGHILRWAGQFVVNISSPAVWCSRKVREVTDVRKCYSFLV